MAVGLECLFSSWLPASICSLLLDAAHIPLVTSSTINAHQGALNPPHDLNLQLSLLLSARESSQLLRAHMIRLHLPG